MQCIYLTTVANNEICVQTWATHENVQAKMNRANNTLVLHLNLARVSLLNYYWALTQCYSHMCTRDKGKHKVEECYTMWLHPYTWHGTQNFELAWEKIIGPPCEAKSFSLFIMSTIFSLNPCISLCIAKLKSDTHMSKIYTPLIRSRYAKYFHTPWTVHSPSWSWCLVNSSTKLEIHCNFTWQ